MGSSFITFREYGFWARDGFIEAYQLLLFEKAQLHQDDDLKWLIDYKGELALESLPLIPGGMSMRLTETLTDESRKLVIIKLINEVIYKITTDPAYLTAEHLNSLRSTIRHYLVSIKEIDWSERAIEKDAKDGAYQGELSKKNYLKAFDLLRKLIGGKLPYKADTAITYWED